MKEVTPARSSVLMELPRSRILKVLSSQGIRELSLIVLIYVVWGGRGYVGRGYVAKLSRLPARRISLAHSLSAIKRVRQNEKRRVRNRADRTRLRTQIKKLRQAVDAGNADEAQKLMPDTISLIDLMVKKRVIHENAGSRYKSRLTRRVAAASAS